MKGTGFGWQGFYLEHPQDWAPVAITGDRTEGYVRFTSPTRVALHLRWKKVSSPGNLESRLRQYFSSLERDAKKAASTFRQDFEQEDQALIYRWQASSQGRGALFHNAACSRVFFLEILAGRKDSILPVFRAVYDSFRSTRGELEPWCLLGLSTHLPPGLRVATKAFHAGKTKLALAGKGVKVVAERWGLAEQLLLKHDLDAWAKAVLDMKTAAVSAEPEGLRLTSRLPLAGVTEALVQHDVERNQLTLLKTVSRRKAWRPKWNWLAASPEERGELGC